MWRGGVPPGRIPARAVPLEPVGQCRRSRRYSRTGRPGAPRRPLVSLPPASMAICASAFTPPTAPCAASSAMAMRAFTFLGNAPSARASSEVYLTRLSSSGSSSSNTFSGSSGMSGFPSLRPCSYPARRSVWRDHARLQSRRTACVSRLRGAWQRLERPLFRARAPPCTPSAAGGSYRNFASPAGPLPILRHPQGLRRHKLLP